MSRSEKLFFNDIIESIDLVLEYISGKTLEDFIASKLLQDAVLRRIEIIGEAVKNISDETKNKQVAKAKSSTVLCPVPKQTHPCHGDYPI